ncbi:MAG: hypothetical protein FP816_19340 [Desulfobacteraceae bacterium]|nr:hypothetical protein [Desulfobacteraceae bacterium]
MPTKLLHKLDSLFFSYCILNKNVANIFVGEMVASGHAKEALEILLESEAKKHLEPLVVGLKMVLGEDVKTAPEIREVAKDVVKRIEMKGLQRKA